MYSIYFFAWAASILYGIEVIISKLISKHSIKNPWLLNFLWTLVVLVFMIPIALWKGATLPSHWLNILAVSFIFSLNSTLFVITLFRFDVTTMSPLFSFRTAFAVILGTLFLGEMLSIFQYVLILIIFMGGFFVSIDEKMKLRSFFSKNILLALFYMLSLASFGAFTKIAVADTSYWTATLWISLLAQIWLLPTIYFFKNDIRTVSKLGIGMF